VVTPVRRHIHHLVAFRRFSPYEVLNVAFSVLGLLSLYLLLEQTRGTFVQAQHLARTVESSAYQSITTELLELHKLHLEHPDLRPYFRSGRDMRPDDPNYDRALVLAEYQLDFFDSFWVQSEQMPHILDRQGPAWLSWINYMRDSFKLSPIMCRHLESVKTWYTPEFVAFAKASCPKGLISQVKPQHSRNMLMSTLPERRNLALRPDSLKEECSRRARASRAPSAVGGCA
jgi:hypothetical protein